MARTAEWFNNLSKKAQAEYLKAHPNSKYGKGVGAITDKHNVREQVRADARLASYGKVSDAELAKRRAEIKRKAEARIVSIKQSIDRYTNIVDKSRLKLKSENDPIKKRKLKEYISDVIAKRAESKKRLSKAEPAVSKLKAHDKKVAADKNKVIAKTPSAKTKAKDNLAKLMETLKRAKARLAKQRRELKVSRSLPTQVLQLEAKVKAAKAKSKSVK